MSVTTKNTINVSPFKTNVLDLIGANNIVNINNQSVDISMPGCDFIVKFDNVEVFRSDNNINVSYFLNTNEIRYC